MFTSRSSWTEQVTWAARPKSSYLCEEFHVHKARKFEDIAKQYEPANGQSQRQQNAIPTRLWGSPLLYGKVGHESYRDSSMWASKETQWLGRTLSRQSTFSEVTQVDKCSCLSTLLSSELLFPSTLSWERVLFKDKAWSLGPMEAHEMNMPFKGRWKSPN